MTGEEHDAAARAALPEHPVRTALLDLLAETGTLTATEAAARLGHSSGLCSFHLRRLARYGLIEEAPHTGGRVRPWRLRREERVPAGEDFSALARGLEDESHRRWLAASADLPADRRIDEAFSAVVHLTPDETAALAADMRRLLAAYAARDARPSARPPGAMPMAAVVRVFPLLDTASG